jgi:DNA repair protein RadC
MNTLTIDEPRGIKAWLEDDRPREKLLAKGSEALTNAELIAIILRSGNLEGSVIHLAQEVMKFGNGNLALLGRCTVDDLQRVKGIGKVKAMTLVAALELGRRRQLSEGLQRDAINNSRAAAAILFPILSDLKVEKFVVLCLNNNNKCLHYEFVSVGGLSGTIVDARVVFRIAIQHMCSKIIIAHNHPSGSSQPSSADKEVTEKIRKGAALLDLRLVDHIIVTESHYFSFADERLL